MQRIVLTAQAVVDEYRNSGKLSPGCHAIVGFDVSDSVTPGWVLLAALEMVVNLRKEVDGAAPEDISSQLAASSVGREVTDLVVRSCLADVDAQREVHRGQLLTLNGLTAMLVEVTRDSGMSDRQIGELLEMSESACRELASSGDAPALHPAKRGVLTGPWDAGETGVRDDQIDFGGIRVPVQEDYEFVPGWEGSELQAVTVARQGTSIQLQAFHDTSWPANRVVWQADIRERGGDVAECMGPAGVELRGWTPTTSSNDESKRKDIRLLGCDGPGWMLYGVVSGRGAHRDSAHSWAYTVFERTVVNSLFSSRAPGETVRLRWPE